MVNNLSVDLTAGLRFSNRQHHFYFGRLVWVGIALVSRLFDSLMVKCHHTFALTLAALVPRSLSVSCSES